MDNAATGRVGDGMVETMSSHMFKQSHAATFYTQSTSEVFDEWFSRFHGPLHFTACSVLGGSEGAELAYRTVGSPPLAIHQSSTMKASSGVGY